MFVHSRKLRYAADISPRIIVTIGILQLRGNELPVPLVTAIDLTPSPEYESVHGSNWNESISKTTFHRCTWSLSWSGCSQSRVTVKCCSRSTRSGHCRVPIHILKTTYIWVLVSHEHLEVDNYDDYHFPGFLIEPFASLAVTGRRSVESIAKSSVKLPSSVLNFI